MKIAWRNLFRNKVYSTINILVWHSEWLWRMYRKFPQTPDKYNCIFFALKSYIELSRLHMKKQPAPFLQTGILLVSLLLTLQISAQNKPGNLKAAAAKISITPGIRDLPKGFKCIRDSLYVRVIVLDNGLSRAALITIDAGMIPTSFWMSTTSKIRSQFGIARENILISATHSHSAPFLGGGLRPTAGSVADPYTESVENKILEAIAQSIRHLEPATIGYNTGMSYLNMNRDVIDPDTRLWTQGPNYEGSSDKTVAVLTITSLTGEPIAVYINYAMHANEMFLSGAISADTPGATCAYIEKYFHHKMIALWTSGAAGDQNPMYSQPMFDVAQVQIDAVLAEHKAKENNEAVFFLFSGGDAGIKVDPDLLQRQSDMISSMGQLLGEEILRVMKYTRDKSTDLLIQGMQDSIRCPGRTRTNVGREGTPGTYIDGDPVQIQLGVLMLNDIALATVNAEIYNPIAQEFKKKSPFGKSIMVTITNGRSNSGYIPSDDAFDRYTFQVLGSALKEGCAQESIVNGLIGLMGRINPPK